ncbi:MAG: hypothetical protein Greene041619_498 [Candidatus Peregrinibacteria bacterium Greene0416_19]|nr:MAG: hypothetical protein Greene041619_498 [Candidatus Peregrinibacteria bacterium Greene0416_19]
MKSRLILSAILALAIVGSVPADDKASVKQQADNAQQAYMTKQAQVEAMRQKRDDADREWRATMKKQKTLADDMAAVNAGLPAARTQLAALETKAAELDTAILQPRADVEALRKAANVLRSELGKKVAAEAQAQVDVDANDTSANRTKLEQAKSELQAATDAFNGKKAQAEAAKNKLATLEQELATAKQQAEGSKRAVAQAGQRVALGNLEIDGLAMNADLLKGEYEALKLEYDTQAKEAATLRDRAAELRQQLAAEKNANEAKKDAGTAQSTAQTAQTIATTAKSAAEGALPKTEAEVLQRRVETLEKARTDEAKAKLEQAEAAKEKERKLGDRLATIEKDAKGLSVALAKKANAPPAGTSLVTTQVLDAKLKAVSDKIPDVSKLATKEALEKANAKVDRLSAFVRSRLQLVDRKDQGIWFADQKDAEDTAKELNYSLLVLDPDTKNVTPDEVKVAKENLEWRCALAVSRDNLRQKAVRCRTYWGVYWDKEKQQFASWSCWIN